MQDFYGHTFLRREIELIGINGGGSGEGYDSKENTLPVMLPIPMRLTIANAF